MHVRSRLIGLLVGWCVATPQALAQGSLKPPILLTVSANHQIDPEAHPGWPIILIADVMHSQLYEDSVPLATISAGASWSSAIQLVAMDAGGNALPWPFHLANAPAGPLTLDSETVEEIAWWITPDETAGIPTGEYTITAYLDSLAVGAPFDGQARVSSIPIRLTMSSAPAGPSDEEKARERFVFADYRVLTGDDEGALNEIDALLAEQPTHVVGLTYRAQLLRLKGDKASALDSYSGAVDAFFDQNPKPQELPSILLQEYYEMLAEIEGRKTFEVTVAAKTPINVYYGEGDGDGYLIDGIESGELWLYEDTTYTFHMVNVPADNPFYFSTSATGNGDEIYSDGVTGQPATGNEEVTITPSASTPDVIYYQSMNQPNMGWRIHIIRDAGATGVAPQPVTRPIEYRLGAAYPNPFSEETRLDLTIANPQRVVATLYNVRGQEVREVFDRYVTATGSEEIVVSGEGLASGWYIIRVRGETFSAARGLILVR